MSISLFDRLKFNFNEGRGLSTDQLDGAFIKSATSADGVWTLTFQNASGVEETAKLPAGWTVAGVEPSSPYAGQGWYDTTANVLKIYDGSAFASLTATATASLADDSVTPAKLDADNATKQDAILTRVNALRRDLNNIATLTIAQQRTALLGLGSLIDGPRPQPAAAYAGRTWIDDHNDRSYICRNRQVLSGARVGSFADDTQVTREGIEIVERLVDLEPPASNVDYGYTSNDNKWWVGTSISGVLQWRETTPVSALRARLSIKPNWTAVWLGQHQWDFNALTQIPQTALPANTDFFFYNSRTVTIRKFVRSTYTAAGTPQDHWQWEPLVATAAEIDIIEARDGNLPSLASDGSDDRKIGVANDGLHFVQLVPEAGTPATAGAWATYVFTNAAPHVRRYIGVHSADPAISASTIGDFFYNSTSRRFRILYDSDGWAFFASHWEDLSDENIAWPTRFIGYHATRAAAIAYAAASGIKTGETFVAFTGTLVETASQFVEGVSARFSRHWRFISTGAAAPGAAATTDDYLTRLVFTITAAGAVKATVTLHEGDTVDATGAELLASKASVTTLAGKTKTSSEIATIADQRAVARYTKIEKDKLASIVSATNAQIQSLVNATQISALQGELASGQIPDAIMLDSEFTASAINTLLGLTALEVSNLFTGATIAGQVITYTKNDGTTVQLTIPAGTAAMADGVVASGAFSADGTTLTLTLDTGSDVVIPVPALPAPTARGANWGRVTFGAKADGNTDVLVASEFGYTSAPDTPTGIAKSDATITLPPDPPSAEIIGLWFVGSNDGLAESMSRPFLWGAGNSEDIFFASGKVMRVIMTRDATTGALTLTFQQIDGLIFGNETIDIYPVITSGSRADNIIIVDNPASRVAPVAANENNLLLRNRTLFRQSVHHGATKSVTWGSVTPITLPGYKGAYDSMSDLPLITLVDDIRFVRRGGHFVKATNTTGRYIDFVPLTFIGSWTREVDATRHAMAIGDIAGFIASTGPNTTQMFPSIVTAFTPDENETRLWVRIDVDVLEAVARNYFGFSLGGIVPGVASRRLSLLRPNGVADIVADLGVQVVYHNTRAEYNLATADGNLHIVTVV